MWAGDPNAPARNHSKKCRTRIAEAVEKDEKRRREEDVEMKESESKRSKVDEDESTKRARKRASDVDVREWDAKRSQRDSDAQAASSSGTKRPAEEPADDSERRDRLEVLTKSGARAPGEVLTLNRLERIYRHGGRQYATSDYKPLLNALRNFGDLPSVAEVYSPPRVAAQAMTIGLRPGFSIDTGTLKPTGIP